MRKAMRISLEKAAGVARGVQHAHARATPRGGQGSPACVDAAAIPAPQGQGSAAHHPVAVGRANAAVPQPSPLLRRREPPPHGAAPQTHGSLATPRLARVLQGGAGGP
eukprot:CAMPEP_0180197174 /NCGR_PEP_ID=MMETSP0987-20121128/4497_1 /TAXON_ID=697907 /ORGANISM="non described non described, Strain CCMP2293" /LENGTH=107 /DNA_ID=CAMNT_0022152099 /DNA_START=190 /DNA_END=514 /DNA_ORIENTATION=+